MERTAASRVDDVQAVAQSIRGAVSTVIEGKPEAIELALKRREEGLAGI